MNKKIEILSRFILSIGLIFIFIKYIGPLLFDYFYSFFKNDKRRNNNDLNSLIERQKVLLKSSSKDLNQSNNNNARNFAPQFDSKLEELITLKLEKIKEEKKKKGLKEVLILLDNIKWGEGTHLSYLRKTLRDKYRVDIDIILINKALKYLLKDDYFLNKRDPDQIPLLSEINQKALVYIYLLSLQDDLFINKTKDHLKQISKYLRMDEQGLIGSLYCLFYKGKNSKYLKNAISIFQDKDLNLSVFQSSKNPQFLLSLIKQKNYKNISEIQSDLKEAFNLLQAIRPIQDISSKDSIEIVCQVLGVRKTDSIDKIKESYKKLAKIKHPDTLKSKGVPEEYTNLATKNFTILKNAYDIIKKYKQRKQSK